MSDEGAETPSPLEAGNRAWVHTYPDVTFGPIPSAAGNCTSGWKGKPGMNCVDAVCAQAGCNETFQWMAGSPRLCHLHRQVQAPTPPVSQHTPTLLANAAIEAVRGVKSDAEICREHGISWKVLIHSRDRLLSEAHKLFE